MGTMARWMAAGVLAAGMLAGSARAQTAQAVVQVGATVVVPASWRADSAAVLRYAPGRFVELANPVRAGGDGERLVSVEAVAGGGGAPVQVRAGGGFRALEPGVTVPLGTRGRVKEGETEDVRYRVDLPGGSVPDRVEMTVRYTVAHEM
jgi:hypothetical protein